MNESSYNPPSIVHTKSSWRQLQECSKTSSTKSNVSSAIVYTYSSVRKKSCGCLRAVVPPHQLQELRSHIQSGKDAMADAMRDLHEGHQQLKRRRLLWHSGREGDCLKFTRFLCSLDRLRLRAAAYAAPVWTAPRCVP